ncbi:hypothetical protein [Metaplanococcus flavidus]|uniref:DUF1851 domain-containing protein n=1 Tax=Metaplanococcus flavidus TaxID=569883 RepID=A0ABW3LCL4_9BACL
MNTRTNLKQMVKQARQSDPTATSNPRFAETGQVELETERIQSLEEFMDLFRMSQLDHRFSPDSTGFWAVGHPTGIFRFPNTESLQVIQWETISEKLNATVHQVYCLEEGFDQRYAKVMQDLQEPLNEPRIPAEILYQQVGLFIRTALMDGEPYYTIDGTCTLEELENHGVEVLPLSVVLGELYTEYPQEVTEFAVSVRL